VHEGLHGDRPATQGPAPLDPRWVELALAGLVVGFTFAVLPRSVIVAGLLVPVLAVYAAALARRWSGGGRLAAFLLLLAVVGLAPTLATMDAYHTTWRPTYGHDGGVIVTGQAAEELLAGQNPYTVSYAGSLRGSALLIDGAWTENPILDRYPYSPGAFLVQVPFAAAALALGQVPDSRWLYLVVYVALGVCLARWSLRERGDLLVPLFLVANPLVLPFLWQGETDVLLLAGLAGLVWALARGRPVLAALALGAGLSVKLLLAPFAVVFLVWLAAVTWRGGLERATALRAAGALALPVAVTAAPFLLWDARAMVQDVVLYQAGLAPPRYPIGGAGLPSLLFDLDVIHDRGAAAPVWSTLLPTLAALAAAGGWVWRRTRLVDLLGAGAAASLGALYFSRAFTMTYWWLPVALLSLAALAGTGASAAAAAVPAAPPEPVPEPLPEKVSQAAP
jgi:Glycosyltransferase family 87